MVSGSTNFTSCVACITNGESKCNGDVSSPIIPDYPSSNGSLNDDGFKQPDIVLDNYEYDPKDDDYGTSNNNNNNSNNNNNNRNYNNQNNRNNNGGNNNFQRNNNRNNENRNSENRQQYNNRPQRPQENKVEKGIKEIMGNVEIPVKEPDV